MDELYNLIHKDVAREARLAASRWNGLLDAEDIEQELWLWILERPGTQAFFKEASIAQRRASLSSRAEAICSSEKVTFEHFTGQYLYTPTKVRELLDTYWGTDVSSVSPEVLDLAEKELSPTMIQNILGGTISSDERVDLEQGLEVLADTHPDYHEAIYHSFYFGESDEDDAMRKRKERGIDKLASIMNWTRSKRENERHEGPGTKPKNTTNQEEN